MATPPPISPVVATPLAHRKRRHSEMVREGINEQANGDDKDNAPTCSHTIPNGVDVKRSSVAIEEELNEEDEEVDEDGDDKSLFEDIIDTAELDPYKPNEETEIDGETGLKPETASKFRELLLEQGPEVFLEMTLSTGRVPAAVLGIAFGLDPMLEEKLGDDLFIRILSRAIVRFYQKRQKLPQFNTIDDAARLIRESNNIMVITGAGISTSLGIPDFRSKGTGFYAQVLEMGINEPEEVFDIYRFDEDPSTFYSLAGGLLPDEERYTPTHGFIRLLQDKDKLQTNYTQNIDNIEERAGIQKQRLIQCHGSFASATCRKCRYSVKGTEIFPDIRAQRVSRCKRCLENMATQDAAPKKKSKRSNGRYLSDEDDESEDDDIPEPGVMKPDITFFGEQLPDTFFERFTERDAKSVDLVLVIGTSLKVAPVSEMPNYLPHAVPHIYISREPIEHVNFDVQLLGDCDTVVFELCKRAGWELKHEMIPAGLRVSVDAVEASGHKWTVMADVDGRNNNEPTGDASVPVDAVIVKKTLATSIEVLPSAL